jgi:hypothetical protein
MLSHPLIKRELRYIMETLVNDKSAKIEQNGH